MNSNFYHMKKCIVLKRKICLISLPLVVPKGTETNVTVSTRFPNRFATGRTNRFGRKINLRFTNIKIKLPFMGRGSGGGARARTRVTFEVWYKQPLIQRCFLFKTASQTVYLHRRLHLCCKH